MPAVKFKPGPLRNIFWIKYLFPVFIIKPGTSYMPLYHIVLINQYFNNPDINWAAFSALGNMAFSRIIFIGTAGRFNEPNT